MASGEAIEGMVGSAAAMSALARLIERCATLNVNVLLRGESGTGKELAARAIHRRSGRRCRPYVIVNGATLCETLGGSALFGHVRGAFTGASETRHGAFRRAHGGTLFIDEVASLSPRMQASLLRVVEDGAVTPVGADRAEVVDVRLVTATCEPLELHVERGSFRGDLYQRLSQCVVRVPPLRERLSDLPSLLSHMLAEPPLEGFSASPCAIAALMAHDFPGNVRELKNLLIQAALTAEECVIDRRVIDLVLAQRRGLRGRRALSPADAVALLAQNEGNVSAAARHARLPRTTFRDLVRRARAEAKAG